MRTGQLEMFALHNCRRKSGSLIGGLLSDERGSAMVEYAVILLVITMLGGAALGTIGNSVGVTLSSVASELEALLDKPRGKGPGDTPCGTAAKDSNKFC
jgi:Flp pilus assembly pilin Flp